MSFADHSLGKSLSDVFSKTPRKEGGKGFLEVDTTSIVAPAENPRKHFDQPALEELAASIRLHGMLQPIVVMRREGAFEIISGERRFRAAKLAGLPKVPVVVRDDNIPQHLAELRLIENIQREDLNPIELAIAYQALLEEHGLTHEELAERISKERSSITNSLRLLALPAVLQQEVVTGALSMGHAKALLSVNDPAWQLTLARRAIEEQLSVRDVERLAKAGPSLPSTGSVSNPGSPHTRELEENLYRLLGVRVKVKDKGGKGALTLYFDGRDQFQQVVAMMERTLKQARAADG